MLFASPWLLGFIVFVGGPILFSIVFSFTRYDVLNRARYVGTANFTDVHRPDVLQEPAQHGVHVLRHPAGHGDQPRRSRCC